MRVHRDDGAAAVEFALVSTLLFLLIFGVIEFGFALYTQQGAAAGAREAARRAAVGAIKTCSGGTDRTDLTYIVKTTAPGAVQWLTAPTMSTSDDNGDGVPDAGDTVMVVVNYKIDFPVLSGFLGFKLQNLAQTGSARIEQVGGKTSCP